MIERISINPSSEVPLFKQLTEQIKGLIANNTLKEGDALPSARQLAKHLGVNPMTISKAMSQLTDEGWLTYQRGQPSRVAAGVHHNINTQQDWLTPALQELISRAKQLHLSRTQLEQLIKQHWQEE